MHGLMHRCSWLILRSEHVGKPRLVCVSTFILFVLLGCGLGWAQQNPPDTDHPSEPGSAETPNTKLPVHKEEIVVTGTYEPVAVSDADRDVERLDVRNERALYPSLVEILRLDPEVDLEERGPNGVQTDVSIRGASFGQTLVLVDGLAHERCADRTSQHGFADAVPVD